MGYYTVYELYQVIDVVTEGVLSDTEKEEHGTQIENESEYKGRLKFLLEWEEVTWNDCEYDMKKYSLQYPNLLFELRGVGEDNAMWNMFVHNGKIKEQGVKIIYNEDYSDLLEESEIQPTNSNISYKEIPFANWLTTHLNAGFTQAPCRVYKNKTYTIMKNYKLKGLNYFVADCRDINHALIVFLHNRCGVTLENIEEVEIESFPEGSKIFYSN